MQLKITAHLIVLICLACPLRGKSLPRKGCYECQEEVWEEVVCSSIPKNNTSSVPSSTVTSAPTTTTTTAAPPKLTTPDTTPTPLSRTSTTTRPELTTPTDPYKKCYCECKLGCKEFCRKVVESPAQKQIIQVSKILEPVAEGRIKSTHILQRELIPKVDESYNSNDNDDDYAPSEADESEPYPLAVESSCEEESEVEPEPEPEPYHFPYHKHTNIRPKSYLAKPIVPLIEPVYGPYAITEATVNKNMHQLESYLARPPQPAYYSPPHSHADYDFPIPFENVYSKYTKSLLDPAHGTQISIDGSMPYAPSAPVINSPLQSRAPLDQYDDSFDSILRNVIQSDPAYEPSYYS